MNTKIFSPYSPAQYSHPSSTTTKTALVGNNNHVFVSSFRCWGTIRVRSQQMKMGHGNGDGSSTIRVYILAAAACENRLLLVSWRLVLLVCGRSGMLLVAMTSPGMYPREHVLFLPCFLSQTFCYEVFTKSIILDILYNIS